MRGLEPLGVETAQTDNNRRVIRLLLEAASDGNSIKTAWTNNFYNSLELRKRGKFDDRHVAGSSNNMFVISDTCT